MDAARAIAITEAPRGVLSEDAYKMFYETFHEELDVLPNTATATAAISELVQGRDFDVNEHRPPVLFK